MTDLCPPPAALPSAMTTAPAPTPASPPAPASGPAPGASSCRPAMLDPAEADWVLQLLQDAAAEHPAPPPPPPSSLASPTPRPTHFEHPMCSHLSRQPHDALRTPHQRRLRSISSTPRDSKRRMVPIAGRVFGRRVPPAARGIDDWWLDPTIRRGRELFLEPATGQVAYFPLPPEAAPCDSWGALLWSCVPIPPMPPVPEFLSPLKSQVGHLIPTVLRPPTPPEPKVVPCTPAILITPPEDKGAQHLTPEQDRSGSTLAVPMF